MVVDIGFTGTQKGMTVDQVATLNEELLYLAAVAGVENIVMHHGDCVGADLEAHVTAAHVGIKIVIHPPIDPVKRAYADKHSKAEVLPPREYLVRNHDIVDASVQLIATPSTPKGVEYTRSGTWSTVRYARRIPNKIIVIIYPDGSLEREYNNGV